jgi:hypothetical protein
VQLLAANSARHHRDVIDVGVGHHRVEGGVRVTGGKAVAEMFVPEAIQELLLG